MKDFVITVYFSATLDENIKCSFKEISLFKPTDPAPILFFSFYSWASPSSPARLIPGLHN